MIKLLKKSEKIKKVVYDRKRAFENIDFLKNEISLIIENSWGIFPDKFILRNLLDSERVFLLYKGEEAVAVCSLDVYYLLDRKIYYIEFLAVKKNYQSRGFGSRLMNSMIFFILNRNFGQLITSSVEVIFITPNIRTLYKASEISSFIYPNPREFSEDGKTAEADETTWAVVKNLIEKSHKPKRLISREGCVLFGSYEDTPWLIYDKQNLPWSHKEKINNFAKKYLGYGKKKDRELIVRMKVTLGSLMKYFVFKIMKKIYYFLWTIKERIKVY